MDLKKFFQDIYHRIIHIDDSPHKIAGGFAVGVFLGILPGAGPVAAIVLAFIFQVNKAAAFAGGLLTNSWFSLLTFVLAVKIGASVTGSNWQQLYKDAKALISPFDWRNFIDGSAVPVIKPLLAGYALIGLAAAVLMYAIVFAIVTGYRKRKKKAV